MIEDNGDLNLVVKKFSTLQSGSMLVNRKPVPTVQMGYRDSSYGGLAKSLGHDIKK